jgi:hypothetical protein
MHASTLLLWFLSSPQHSSRVEFETSLSLSLSFSDASVFDDDDQITKRKSICFEEKKEEKN